MRKSGCRSNRAKWQGVPMGTSDTEAFAAAALAAHVGVVEPEPLVEPFLGEVQLGAVEVDQALGIDDHLHAVALEDLILGLEFIDELQHVGQAGTAGGAHSKADAQALATPFQRALDMAGGRFSHADCHDASSEQTLLLLV